MDTTSLVLLIAVILAAIASFQPSAGPVHLGWLALAFLALGHLI